MKLIAFLSIYCLFIYSVYLIFHFPDSIFIHIQGKVLDTNLEKDGDYLVPKATIKQGNQILKEQISAEQYKFYKIGDNIEIKRYQTSSNQIAAGLLIFCALIFIIIEIVIWTGSFNDSLLGMISEEISDILEKLKR